MPERVEDCKQSVLEDNPEYSESRAYAICWAQENEGNLAADKETVVEVASQNNLSAEAANQILSNDNVNLDDPCWEGYTMVGQKIDENGNEVPNCVPDEDVPDANMSIANSKLLAVGTALDKQPIKREELSGDKVAYRNIKLLDTGVWTDQNSQTPTLYDETTFSNINAVSESNEQGPPTNIAHDVHKRGANKGEPHEASVGGYVDPKSLRTDGEALFGDFIFDTSKPAGDFADANLKSALKNDGTAGFSPSVELEPVEMAQTVDHPHAQEHVKSARLTGVGLVRDPASESVDLMEETQERAVALAAGEDSPKGKTVAMQKADMTEKQLMNADEIRETLDMFGFDGLDEMTDDEVMDMAEDLHGDLMEQLQGDDDMGNDMGNYGDDDMGDGEDDDDPEDEEDDDDMDMEGMADTVASLSERLEEVENALAEMDMGELATEGDVEEVESELAALKPDGFSTEEVRKTLASIGNEGKEARTLAEDNVDEEYDWSLSDDGVNYDPATGTTSR
ncbi:hypothetical protein OSG_eHP1_00020 [environmental Halophage eHP-1]|nr:hypothetical protein OSG_eHP1_00020 [environmental Halophage eHP-1]AFH22231.1 hypothetical protein OSG_eHP19_00130 [environmental Halophage eHP-19]